MKYYFTTYILYTYTYMYMLFKEKETKVGLLSALKSSPSAAPRGRGGGGARGEGGRTFGGRDKTHDSLPRTRSSQLVLPPAGDPGCEGMEGGQ